MEQAGKELLVVDDEENMRHMMSALLGKSGYRIELADDGETALGMVREKNYDFILCDLKMPRMDGLAFLDAAREYLGESTVVMMSAFGTMETALTAIKRGAYDFITKPFKADEVLLTLKKAEERETLKRENLKLKERIKTITNSYHFGNMMAKSSPMQQVFKTATKAAKYDTTVLVTGESGTGKEMVTKGIHFNSPRSKLAFIPVNCGGIPENLLESELFGYQKGAFTGADRDKPGLVAAAHGGTLFLDEIGEMPLNLQVKLLRVLQEKEIMPIGGSRGKKVDVRIISATSKKLADEVDKGNFREDLFYRLNVITITLPPLRERPEDIPLLVQNFITKFNRKLRTDVRGVSTGAMKSLLSNEWPGNVRQLENAIERAMVLSDEKILQPEHFLTEIAGRGQGCGILDGLVGFSLKKAKRVMERALISKALSKTGGNRTHAAELLEISHPSLLSKIKDYEIEG